MSEKGPQPPIPNSFWIGQDLDWEAPTIPVNLRFELPFWIMTPNCTQEVEVHGHKFSIEIKDEYVELYVGAVSDSRCTCLYIGPPRKLKPEVGEALKKSRAPVMSRKCKTVLLIHSACNKDVLVASKEKGERSRQALLYLKSFCEAHIEVVNRLIQQYRLCTYDYFAHEVSPWDAPIWFVDSAISCTRVILQDYAAFDDKPIIISDNVPSGEQYKLTDGASLQAAMATEASAGEFELLDALNLMERGDYSSAVRRITTAIEAQTASALRNELLKTKTSSEVDKMLKASENDFPGRLRQYQKLSGRTPPTDLRRDIRTLRHSIVHNALRISFNQRGQAQKAVDTGRWFFNWLENQPTRSNGREKLIAKRSIGRHFSIFSAEITPAGVVVHKPPMP